MALLVLQADISRPRRDRVLVYWRISCVEKDTCVRQSSLSGATGVGAWSQHPASVQLLTFPSYVES